jgi:hypothetical protein
MGPQTGQLDTLVGKVLGYAQQAITFLMLLATIWFIIIVIQLIMAKDGTVRKEKKAQLKWAVIGLAIMVTVWGIIRFAASTLGISTNSAGINVPCPPGTQEVRISGVGTVCR